MAKCNPVRQDSTDLLQCFASVLLLLISIVATATEQSISAAITTVAVAVPVTYCSATTKERSSPNYRLVGLWEQGCHRYRSLLLLLLVLVAIIAASTLTIQVGWSLGIPMNLFIFNLPLLDGASFLVGLTAATTTATTAATATATIATTTATATTDVWYGNAVVW